MTSIKLIFRPSHKKDSTKGYLSLRLIHQRKVKLISTGIEIRSKEWDEQQMSIVTTSPDIHRQEYLQDVSLLLRSKMLQLQQLQADFASRGDYELDSLVYCYHQFKAKNSSQAYTQLLARDLSREHRPRTADAYLCAMRRFIQFNNNKDISLNEINARLVTRFEQQLKNEGLKLNTISFYMRNLRAIYNKAIQEKRLPAGADNPFQQVYTGVQVTRKRALSKEEMNKIYSLDLKKLFKKKTDSVKLKNLLQARDLFMFSFYARGMSFVDLVHLKKTDIKDDVLTYYRKKTGQQLEIAITKPMREIVDRYILVSAHTHYLFPIIKDTKKPIRQQYLNGLRVQNNSLQRLKKLASLQKHLSTHVARHSWASIAKEEELPIWTISESLGHSTVKTTYIYLASINQSRLDQANEQVGRAVCF